MLLGMSQVNTFFEILYLAHLKCDIFLLVKNYWEGPSKQLLTWPFLSMIFEKKCLLQLPQVNIGFAYRIWHVPNTICELDVYLGHAK